MNLRSKIFTNSLLLILIPILLTAAAVYFLLVRSFDRRETEQREASIRESIAQVKYRGRSVENLVALLAKTPSVTKVLENPLPDGDREVRVESARKLLINFLDLDRFALGVEVLDSDGKKIVSVYKSENDKAAIGSRSGSFFRRAFRVGPNQTPIFKVGDQGYATSFTDVVGKDTVLGAVIYTQDMRYFEEPLRNQVREGVGVTCFDELGVVWARLSSGSLVPNVDTRVSLSNGEEFEDSFRQLRNIESEKYFETTKLLYTYRQTGSFEPLPGENWYVSIIETNTTPAGLWPFQVAFATIVVITIAGVFWVSAVSAKRITEPIERVSKATSKIARGEEDLDLDISTGDEVEELADAVKRMNADLRDYQKRVVETARLTAMGEMTSEISHEIQNRISGVSLWLQHLDAEIPADDEKREYIDEMKLGLDGFLEMLSGLKAFYRKPQIEKSEFEFKHVVDEALATVAEKAEIKGIVFEHVKSENSLLLGDREQLKSVFINLLINAVEASPDGGTVSLKFETRGDFLELRITDQGPGIREPEVQKVFYPFYTTKASGSGLGLAISKNVIDAHGGSITVEKTGSDGTEFLIRLSVDKEKNGQDSSN